MIKISVFGHSADSFSNEKSISYSIDNAIAVIKRQHSHDNIRFLLNCEPGINQWFCNSLIEHGLLYEVYLSTVPEDTIKYWTEQQQEMFNWQINKASAVHIFGIDNSQEFRIKRNKRMIDESQWTIVFWNGKHQGYTYDAMKYAIETNKIVFNGIGDTLNLVDRKVLDINRE